MPSGRLKFLLSALLGFQLSSYANVLPHESGHSILIHLFSAGEITPTFYNWWNVFISPWVMFAKMPYVAYNVFEFVLYRAELQPVDVGWFGGVSFSGAEMTQFQITASYLGGILFQTALFILIAYVGLRTISPTVAGLCSGLLFGSSMFIWACYTDMRYAYGHGLGWFEEVEGAIVPTQNANMMAAYTLSLMCLMLLVSAYLITKEAVEIVEQEIDYRYSYIPDQLPVIVIGVVVGAVALALFALDMAHYSGLLILGFMLAFCIDRVREMWVGIFIALTILPALVYAGWTMLC